MHCIFLQLSGICETKENRRQLPKQYAAEDVVFNLGRSALTAAAFVSQNFSLLNEGTQDRLHQPHRFQDNLVIADLEQKLIGSDFFGLALSGFEWKWSFFDYFLQYYFTENFMPFGRIFFCKKRGF